MAQSGPLCRVGLPALLPEANGAAMLAGCRIFWGDVVTGSTTQPADASTCRSTSRMRRWAIVLVFFALAAGGAVSALSLRTHAGPASGTQFVGTPPRPHVEPNFRVATFNIHGAKGTDDVEDIRRIAELLRGRDLAGLNEVQGPFFGEPDQATRLGDILQMPSLFAPAENRWARPYFGNGLLSALPVRHWFRIPLPDTQRKGLRNGVLATVTVAGQDVDVLVTHIDRTVDRQAQLRVVLALFDSLQAPVICMGDFNTRRDDPQLAAMLARPDVRDAAVGAPGDFAGRIDWILVRGLDVLDAEVVSAVASDHPIVRATLGLPAERPEPAPPE